jgi:hypothetical protein
MFEQLEEIRGTCCTLQSEARCPDLEDVNEKHTADGF